MDNELHGQVAVITGGGRGIGEEIARALAMAGAQVVITGRDQSRLDAAAETINAQGGACAAYTMDVLDAEAVPRVLGKIADEYGAIDLLVNNAGVGGLGKMIWDMPAEDWWRVLEVNLRGAFLCAHAVLPMMLEHKSGRIINIGSNAGLNPVPFASAYSVSKSALLHLTGCIAAATSEHHVSTFVVNPGLVLTDMTRDVEYFKSLPASAWTPIEKVGELCVALATGQADALSGRYIHVTEDDIDDLVLQAEQIVDKNLNVMQFVR